MRVIAPPSNRQHIDQSRLPLENEVIMRPPGKSLHLLFNRFPPVDSIQNCQYL